MKFHLLLETKTLADTVRQFSQDLWSVFKVSFFIIFIRCFEIPWRVFYYYFELGFSHQSLFIYLFYFFGNVYNLVQLPHPIHWSIINSSYLFMYLFIWVWLCLYVDRFLSNTSSITSCLSSFFIFFLLVLYLLWEHSWECRFCPKSYSRSES